MNREVRVRFCEILGVRLPGATHSYGFRPGPGQHDALDALYVEMARKKVNWVPDLDVRSFLERHTDPKFM
jgi:hypothetical protein